MTRLIIAEKPDMGRKIAAALAKPHKAGQGYIETAEGIVSWCIGHIMKSFEPKEYNAAWEKWDLNNLPMIIDEWKIKVDSDKAGQFKIIKDLLGRVDEVVNAGDPGREGQLIVDEVLYYLKNKKPVKRVLLYALDQKSIKQAFAQLQDNALFYPLYEAGVCRGYADWEMGMNGTVAYTLKAQQNGYKGVLSVGRVQSPTLAIVVRRDEEIDNFVPHDFYTILATFKHLDTNFNAYWKPNDNTPSSYLDSEKRITDKSFAINVSNKVKGKNGVINDYEEKDGKEPPPFPFNLSKMQIYANAKWGMSAKEVLDTCQALYEKHELQTYPRTDCQYLPENQFTDAPIILAHISKSHQHLSNAVQGSNSNLKSNAWDDSKLGEHFGLIPTKKEADLSQLSEKEKKIYQAVCERYIAQFYPACEFRTAVVTVECETEIFKANGKVIIKAGWRQIFNNDEEAEDKKDDEEEQIFPALKNGEKVLCQNSKLSEKKTAPPGRYTEGTLIKAMTNVHTLVSDPDQKKKLKEKKGIGQEATRTNILETLFKRVLLVRQGKQIESSSAGKALVKALPKKVTDPALTAVWEDALDKIAEGKMSSAVFKQKQKEWVTKLVEEAKLVVMDKIEQAPVAAFKGKSTAKTSVAGKGKTSAVKSGAVVKGKTCPKCGTGILVKKVAKASGKEFIACNTWPKCDHAEWPKK
jgi:DNA topoisomerase-3